MTSRLQLFPARDCLVAPYLMEKFDPVLLDRLLGEMTLKNSLVLLSSHTLTPLPLTEPIYQATYSVEPLPEDLLAFEKEPGLEPTLKALALPEENPYIPRENKLLALPPQETPELAWSTPRSRLFYCADQETKSATACLNLTLLVECERALSARLLNVTTIVEHLLAKSISEHSYLAECASLNLKAAVRYDRLDLSFSGFSEVMPLFVYNTVVLIKQFFEKPEVSRLPTALSETRNKLVHVSQTIPYRSQVSRLEKALLQGHFELAERFQQLDVTEAEVADYLASYLKGTRLFMLAIGNLDRKACVDLAGRVEQIFADTPVSRMLSINRAVEIGDSRHLLLKTVLEPIHLNSSLLLFKQAGLCSPAAVVLCHMVANLLEEGFSDYVRTKNAVGYAVHCGLRMIHNICGVYFNAQSCDFTPLQMLAIFQQFFAQAIDSIASLSLEQFDLHKESVKGKIDEK